MKLVSMRRYNKIKSIACVLLCVVVMLCCVNRTALAADAQAGYKGFRYATVIYGVILLLSLLMLIGYFKLAKKRTFWFALLYSCVFIVNLGYFLLSVAGTLKFALIANGVAYFGSVFLPLCMLMIIMEVCQVRCSKVWLAILLTFSVTTFLLAASADHLQLYYRKVSLEIIDGVAKLVKVYGPLHIMYLVYLLTYFGAMIGVILYAVIRHKLPYYKQALLLAALTLSNMAVWFIEQKIDIDFEFLSVTYIITELLLLLLYDVLQGYGIGGTQKVMVAARQNELPPDMEELFSSFVNRVALLTPAEHMMLQYYIDGCTLEEFAEKSFISINTAKKHNTNMNRKLGIRSREELLLYIELFRRSNRLHDIQRNT